VPLTNAANGGHEQQHFLPVEPVWPGCASAIPTILLPSASAAWPVLTSEVDERTDQPKPLRPETALDLAREEVIRLRKRGLLLGREV